MLISCEKCSTTYVLDDALIPPQGAPVQCTRCGHVFTARLQQLETTPIPPPKVPAAWENHPDLANKPATSTLVFGGGATARPPPPQPAPVSQTMVFGTPAVQPRSAPPATAASAPARSNQTVIFGTPAGAMAQPPAPAAPVVTKTLPFGTPSAPAPGGNRTVIFGMPGAAPPPRPSGPKPPAGASNQTMVFGAPAQPGSDASSPPEASRTQTMMFGRAPGKGIPKVTVGSGEQAGYAASEDNRLSESTVRVDLDALAGDLGGTTDDSPQVRHDRTVLFAMKTEGAGAGPAAVPPAPAPAMERDRSNQTVLFAMNPAADDAAESPVFEGELASGAAPALPVVQGVPQTTLIFAGNPGGSPTSHQGVGDPDAQDSSSGSTAPEIPPIEPGRLDLPPEDRFLHAAATVANEPTAPDEEAIARLRAAANRRTTIAVVVFLALALGLALALVWYLFGKALVGGSSAALEAQAREVIALLRRDDEAAHRGAMTRARALLEHAPRSVDAQAALVLATAFATDDASARARRHRDQSEAIRRRLDRLSDQSPSRPELARQLELARDESRGATADAEVLQGALKTETQTLLGLAQTTEKLPPAQQLAALRARSVSLAVQGEATALALAEEFNQKAGTPDVWNDLALPEYVANGGSSYDEAQRQLEAIEARDDTFLRAYVLSARIALLRRDTPGAEAQLAKVLAFHPGHDAALQLLAWVRTHRQDD